jgi:hypothetical protein
MVTPAGAMAPATYPQGVPQQQTGMYPPTAQPVYPPAGQPVQPAQPMQPQAVPGPVNRGYTMAPPPGAGSPPAGGTPNGTTNQPAGQAKEGRQWNVFGR